MPAIAEESSSHRISGTVRIGTDYYFRGVSETDKDPNIQGSIDYEHKSGFYAGIWGGNIEGDSEYVCDFSEWTYCTDSASIELDFYAGYWRKIGDVELDLMVIYQYFPGNADAGLKKDPDIDDWIKGEAEADYWEFHIGLAYRFNLPTVPKLSVGYDFSPDFWGEDGIGHHFNAVLDLGLPYDFVLAGEAGYQYVEGDKQSGCDSTGFCYGVDGDEGFDYWYYRIGLSREIFGINCDLSYHFGNTERSWFEDVYGSAADDQVIFYMSYTFGTSF
jgi:uncharacterized protein (TIGR02001 family)